MLRITDIIKGDILYSSEYGLRRKYRVIKVTKENRYEEESIRVINITEEDTPSIAIVDFYADNDYGEKSSWWYLSKIQEEADRKYLEYLSCEINKLQKKKEDFINSIQ